MDKSQTVFAIFQESDAEEDRIFINESLIRILYFYVTLSNILNIS